MDALFIGHTYIDVTVLADAIPGGDDKAVAQDYAVSFGGNAVTAAFAATKLGLKVDLLTTLANDWLGRMFSDMAARYDVTLHSRLVRRSSLSFIMPRDGKRAVLRARDTDYLHPYPKLNLTGCRGLHVDGHQGDAALDYARTCRAAGMLTSLDGGTVRETTHEILAFIDVAVVSELFCEQMKLSGPDTLRYLKSRGCRIAGVTLGGAGMIWMDADGVSHQQPAIALPRDKVIDTNGAGDVFHGAYFYSALTRPTLNWADHFRFATAASAHAVQHLGNEAKLPTLGDIARIEAARGG